jgi:hypothetical protein
MNTSRYSRGNENKGETTLLEGKKILSNKGRKEKEESIYCLDPKIKKS